MHIQEGALQEEPERDNISTGCSPGLSKSMKENLDGLVQAKERIEDVHIVQLVHIQDKRFQLNFKADEKVQCCPAWTG